MIEHLSDEEKASRIQAIVGDPVFNEAIDNLRNQIIKGWEVSNDPKERDALWHRQMALTDLVKALHGVTDNVRFENFRRAKIAARK